MERYFLIKINSKENEARDFTILNYLSFQSSEDAKELDGLESFGEWARGVFGRYNKNVIECAWIETDGKKTDVFFNTEKNTIKHIRKESRSQ